MRGLSPRRPSPAMIVALIALVMASVGTGYAAFKLPKNSVGTKQIKNNAVTLKKIKKNSINSAKVKKNSLTGADINLNKLGTVPSAETANTVPPREGVHLVGAPNEPPFGAGVSNLGGAGGLSFSPVGFFKDHDEVVHLEGIAKATTQPVIFILPPGFRPASGIVQVYETPVDVGVTVIGSNVVIEGVDLSGAVLVSKENTSLSGISFRAGS